MEFVPSRIIGVKIKYLIAALLQHGMTIEKISECIDWAEDLMEVDAKMHENEDILNLAARF